MKKRVFYLVHALRVRAKMPTKYAQLSSAGHKNLQYVPEHQRNSRKQPQRCRDILGVPVLVYYCACLVKNRKTRKGEHRHGKPKTKLKSE